MSKASLGCLAVLVPLCLVWACGSSGDGGSGGSSGNAAGDGSGASAAGGDNLGGDGNGAGVGTGASSAGGSLNLGGATGAGGTTNTGGSISTGGTINTGGTVGTDLCGDAGCTCSNGVDDDEDGLVDGFDPECTGPFDNDEGSFATGIPGDNRDPKWQDCFFDGNSGAGDDGCRYETRCLTGELAADHKDCQLTQACIDFCAPRTPNGCDCFGCCTVQLPSGDTVDILTGSDCSVDKADDAEACPVCVKSDLCGNNCGTCELCPGKTVEDLPDECSPSGTGGAGSGTGGAGSGTGGAGDPGDPGDPGYTCDDGLQVCGPDLPSCPIGRYCSLGCCLLKPVR